MKKIILLFSMILTTSFVVAQADVISKHSGENVTGKVIRVDEYTVVFK